MITLSENIVHEAYEDEAALALHLATFDELRSELRRLRAQVGQVYHDISDDELRDLWDDMMALFKRCGGEPDDYR